MAGTGWKATGIVFLVMGGLLLVGGGIGAVSAGLGEGDNQDGLLASGERSEANQAVFAGSLVAGGVGVLLIALGIVFVVTGASRAASHAPIALVRKPVAARVGGRSAQILGWVAVVVGILLVVGALAAVGYVYVDEQDNRGNGPLADPERSNANEDVARGAVVAAGSGVLFLLVGGLVAFTGGRLARPSQRIRISPAAAKSTGAGAAVFALVLLLAVLVAQQGISAGTSDPAPAFSPQDLDGTILAVPPGSAATLALEVPAGAEFASATVTWTSPPSGPTQLAVALVASDGTVLVESSGGSPLELTGKIEEGVQLRAAVISGTFVSQDFHASVAYT